MRKPIDTLEPFALDKVNADCSNVLYCNGNYTYPQFKICEIEQIEELLKIGIQMKTRILHLLERFDLKGKGNKGSFLMIDNANH
jgi:hypothetical protein